MKIHQHISSFTFALLLAGAALFFAVFTIPEKEADAGKYIPSDWFHLQRAYPYSEIPYEKYLAAMKSKETMMKEILAAGQWVSCGPDNIGGRITAMAVNPLVKTTVYIGAAAGGVLKTTNGGESWLPLTDAWPSLSIGALAIDPQNPSTIYCGTGEANISTDSYAGFGMLKSTDAGASWVKAGLDSSRHIAEIEIRKGNTKHIFAAVSGGLYSKGPHRGIYRTMDGGVTWHKVLYLNDSTSAIDVALDPADTSIVYAAMWERLRGPTFRKAAGISTAMYRSSDGGWTWTRMTAGLPQPSALHGRISIAVSPSNPSYVYALYKSATSANGSTNGFFGFYRSTDKGINWSRMPDGPFASEFSTFGWYFGTLEIDPVDFRKVYVGEVDLFRSTDGGTSWQNITNSYSGTWDQQHPDQHPLWIDPQNTQMMYCGNDGGFFVTGNGGGTWTKKYNLPISQFYAACVDYNNPLRTYGGTQDNGTIGTNNGMVNNWTEVYGGDGFTCHIDYTNPNIMYCTYQNGGLGRSTDGGVSFTMIRAGADFTRTNWSTPYIIDPQIPQNLYLGTYKLYKTTNRGDLWNAISPDLTRGANGRLGTITAISAARGTGANDRILYVATDDAKLSVSTDDGLTWNDRTGTLPRRYMTDVVADKRYPATAYVTLSGYNLDEVMPHIFRTTNYGQTWSSISSGLPDIPVNSLVIDYAYDGVLYIGTDAGVFFTLNGGAAWKPLGTMLPNSPVFDIFMHAQSKTLFAATHGRSLFKYDLTGITSIRGTTTPAPPTGFILLRSYPNPFNPSATIELSLPYSDFTRVDVLNASGETVVTLAEHFMEAGRHSLKIEGRNLSSGVYFVRAQAKGKTSVIKIVSMK